MGVEDPAAGSSTSIDGAYQISERDFQAVESCRLLLRGLSHRPLRPAPGGSLREFYRGLRQFLRSFPALGR